MNVPKGYLNAESRDGFYVSSKMKRTWAATIEVFKAVEKVCLENDITYFAEWGTLLGAVRHGGFIPWDDDFDICMKREDYNRFLQIAKEALPKEYAVLNVYNEFEYTNLLTRVVNRKQISFEKEYMEAFHGFPYIVGIDIYPIDYVTDDEANLKSQLSDLLLVDGWTRLYEASQLLTSTIQKEVFLVAKRYNFIVDKRKPIRQQLFILMDRIMSWYGAEEGSTLVSLPYVIKYNMKGIPAYYYDDVIRIPFEYTDIAVPLLYDDMLERKYRNYIRSVRNWNTHMYPVYLGIEQEVHELGRNDIWPDYSVDEARKDLKEYLNDKDKESILFEKEDVIFMPYKAEAWRYMEPFWNMLQEENVNTLLMPIPYYEKDDKGKPSILHYDKAIFDEYYETIDINYDFSQRPMAIVIQNPYDNYDVSECVAPIFFSRNLKKYTNNLIYIPDFQLDEFGTKDERAMYNMNFFCTVPGVIYSDYVFVQSQSMKERYLDKLGQFLGESMAEVWERKIKVQPWTNQDEPGIVEDEIPAEWWDKLLDDKGDGKKVILYYSSASKIYEKQQKYINKIGQVFEMFSRFSDSLTVIWLVDEVIFRSGCQKLDKLRENVENLMSEYGTRKNVIVDTDHQWEAIQISDAFYGDRGRLLHEFERTGRPIMIQDVECVENI